MLPSRDSQRNSAVVAVCPSARPSDTSAHCLYRCLFTQCHGATTTWFSFFGRRKSRRSSGVRLSPGSGTLNYSSSYWESTGTAGAGHRR